MKFQHLFIIIGFCLMCQTFGQTHENAVPFSAIENLDPVTNFVDLPSVDSLNYEKEFQSSQGNKNQLQFACPIYTDLDPDNSGKWEETSLGSVWRLGIRSDKAYSLYVIMEYLLSAQVKMFIYAPGYKDLRGAFTHRNNNSSKLLSIAPVGGDKLIIELNLPSHQHSYGKIKITKVFHDYLNVFNTPSGKSRKSAVVCDEDINCTNGMYWQTEKRSVVKIISNGYIGTGTLIGNTGLSKTPYVLSAYHLISSPGIAAEAIFLLNYETTACGDNTTTLGQALSGASLLSTTDNKLDFALMKLNEIPPPSYQPFYAGWDASNNIPKKGVCIHHPFGNAKQISIEYHPIVSEDIGMGFEANSTWKVQHWDIGTTESGSSGAPLFNEQHRVIGTLSGGRSICGYSKDDYFNKFGVSWDIYPDSSNQLKYWLDPVQTGQIILDGYDPYGFNSEYCDTAWNFSAHDKLGLSNESLAWGFVSGHSSAGYTQFAERYESPGLLQIKGVYLHAAKASYSNPLAYIELKVWEGNKYPEKECYSKLLFIKDILPNKVTFIAFDSVLKKSGSFFAGYKINYNASDTFALYHAMDRGYRRASSMYVYNERWYESKDPAALGISTSLALGISECYGKSRQLATSVLNVYPNPCSNSVTLEMPDAMPINEVKCFDINGRKMPVTLRQNEKENKLYFNLKTGIYFLKIVTTEKSFVSPLIVE